MNRKFVSNSNYVLRKILNNDNCSEITKDFIESILDIQIKEIKVNPYLQKKSRYLPKEENFGIVDVRIKTDENEEMNIGIQIIDGLYVQTKILMYYAQIHLNQLEYEDEREYAKTVTINILDFNYYKSKDYFKKVKITTNEKYVKEEELEFYVIELPKFIEKQNMDKKEEWITYIKGSTKEKIEQIKNSNIHIKTLDDMAEKYWLEEKME